MLVKHYRCDTLPQYCSSLSDTHVGHRGPPSTQHRTDTSLDRRGATSSKEKQCTISTQAATQRMAENAGHKAWSFTAAGQPTPLRCEQGQPLPLHTFNTLSMSRAIADTAVETATRGPHPRRLAGAFPSHTFPTPVTVIDALNVMHTKYSGDFPLTPVVRVGWAGGAGPGGGEGTVGGTKEMERGRMRSPPANNTPLFSYHPQTPTCSPWVLYPHSPAV